MKVLSSGLYRTTKKDAKARNQPCQRDGRPADRKTWLPSASGAKLRFRSTDIVYIGFILGLYWGYIGVILGLCLGYMRGILAMGL